MPGTRLVAGLYDAAFATPDAPVQARLRDLSLSWIRFGYRGPVVEGRTPSAVLGRAAELSDGYCLLFATGTIFDENWYPLHWGRHDIHALLAELMSHDDFLAAGRIETDHRSGILRLDERCLLVNLRRYLSLARPDLAGAIVRPAERRAPDHLFDRAHAAWMLRDCETKDPGATIRAFDPAINTTIVDLADHNSSESAVAFPGGPLHELPRESGAPLAGVTVRQHEFLTKIRNQIDGAKRGVFPWNLESYDDVDMPLAKAGSPLSSVYCVAAGFKPYRILKSQGFDPTTRVVLFDYSAHALEFRRRLIAEWDGTDFPGVLRAMFSRMPADTYFQLWADLTPERVSDSDLDRLWQAETARWGGEDAFRDHWNACRGLPHEYVHCDLLGDPDRLIDRIDSEPTAAIWWSNAFFTIHSNWLMTIADRRTRYARFIRGLAAAAPALWLYGADHLNRSVNSVGAQEYAAALGEGIADDENELKPVRYQRIQIRS